MKLHNNVTNIDQIKTVTFKTKIGDLGETKYFPSFSKEWKNTVYFFNKNQQKNIPLNNDILNNIIRAYFNMYFKNFKYVGLNKFILRKRRRNLLKSIHISNIETKHTNNKIIVSLYTINKQKKVLEKKFLLINDFISKFLLNKYTKNYKHNLYRIYKLYNSNFDKYKYINSTLSKKEYLRKKFYHLNKFLVLKNLYAKKFWSNLILNYSRIHLKYIKKYNLLYSLNQFKFNKLYLLAKLSNLLSKITNKKLTFNIIHLKSMVYNTDIFTKILSLKLSKRKYKPAYRSMESIIGKSQLPVVNRIQERSKILLKSLANWETFNNRYKDLRLISNLKNTFSLSQLFDSTYTKSNIHNVIYNLIKYKNMSGIRLEVRGRLTKRYRADRAIYFARWKGGLKNIDSSYKRINTVLYRGNSKSNTSYSLATSKRRIGAFAVKGWIGGK